MRLSEVITELIKLHVEIAIEEHEASRHEDNGIRVGDSRPQRIAALENEIEQFERWQEHFNRRTLSQTAH